MGLRSFKTTKGTELPLLNLRGREYLEVKYRLVWFREEHPDWSIETELLTVTDDSASARAVIRDESGRIIATSHKFENRQGFPDFIEKAETGAIGRALALIGYGTQFCADELDEGKRIVDAPVDTRPARPTAVASSRRPQANAEPAASSEAADGEATVGLVSDEGSEPADRVLSPAFDPAEYRINFGKKYKGRKLREIPRQEIEGYVDWLEATAQKKGVPLSQEVRYLKIAVDRLYSETASH